VWALPFIPVIYFLGFGLVLLLARERVAISARVFKRVWQFPLGSWTRRIPIGDIEELVSSTDDVIIRTDRSSCRVGCTLNSRERRWLRDAIQYLLVNGHI
jgi:hypothetical protein